MKDYSNWSPRPATIAKIEAARRVIEEAAKGGFRLTLRAVFYRIVARNIIPNTKQAYKSLSETLGKARWAGMLPFDCIDDPERSELVGKTWGSVRECLEGAARTYRTRRVEKLGPRCGSDAKRGRAMAVPEALGAVACGAARAMRDLRSGAERERSDAVGGGRDHAEVDGRRQVRAVHDRAGRHRESATRPRRSTPTNSARTSGWKPTPGSTRGSTTARRSGWSATCTRTAWKASGACSSGRSSARSTR